MYRSESVCAPRMSRAVSSALADSGMVLPRLLDVRRLVHGIGEHQPADRRLPGVRDLVLDGERDKLGEATPRAPRDPVPGPGRASPSHRRARAAPPRFVPLSLPHHRTPIPPHQRLTQDPAPILVTAQLAVLYRSLRCCCHGRARPNESSAGRNSRQGRVGLNEPWPWGTWRTGRGEGPLRGGP